MSLRSWGTLVRVALIIGATLVTVSPSASNAAAGDASRQGTLVVRNDPGGRLAQRVQAVARLRQNGTRVEITGSHCLSACTLYLGLPQACVSPRTIFGFHGPSFHGHPLSKREFDHWSHLMARHYPQPLRDWFLRSARNRLQGYHELRGSDLIQMGLRRC